MGDYRITIEAVGGHGCSRKTKSGEKVVPCGQRSCPDCAARELVARIGGGVTLAKLEHWPVPGAAGTTRTEDPGPVDDLLTGIRSGQFADAAVSGFGRLLAVLALGLLALLVLCGSARAQEPIPSPGAAVAWSASTFAGAIRTAGAEVKPIVGARFAVKVDLPAGFVVAARVDASRQQDGGAGVELADPSTFQTAEGYGAIYRDIWKGVGLAGIYGAAVPFEGGRAVALERYPQTMLGALRFGSPGLTIYAGAGKHDAAGEGVKAFASAEVATGGKTATQVEIVEPNGYVRVFAILRLR